MELSRYLGNANFEVMCGEILAHSLLKSLSTTNQRQIQRLRTICLHIWYKYETKYTKVKGTTQERDIYKYVWKHKKATLGYDQMSKSPEWKFTESSRK